MKIWLTSDTHFAHKNSLKYCGRPFLNAEDMDEAIICNWNELVSPEDTIYHLGDVAMQTAAVKRIMPRLNGKKILVVGNHDLMYPYFTKTRGVKFTDKAKQDYLAAGFAEIRESFIMNTTVGQVRLSHFPTKNAFDNYHNDKHDHMRPDDTGILNICGHVHQAWLKHGNNINVGVDVWDFKPVELDDVLALWAIGPDNVPTPNKMRIMFWKIVHKIKGLI